MTDSSTARSALRSFRLASISLALSAALVVVTAWLSMADTCPAATMYGVFALSIAAALLALVLALVAVIRGSRSALGWTIAALAWTGGLGLLVLDVGVFVAATMACAAPR